jgi:hypothetical protein
MQNTTNIISTQKIQRHHGFDKMFAGEDSSRWRPYSHMAWARGAFSACWGWAFFNVISEVIFRSPFCAYQVFLCFFSPERPFFAHRHTETILCLSGFFMLTIGDTPLYACQAFLCLSADKWLHFVPIIVEKKLNRFILKRPFFRERSVRFDFFVPPKKQTSFRFISLIFMCLSKENFSTRTTTKI